MGGSGVSSGVEAEGQTLGLGVHLGIWGGKLRGLGANLGAEG